MNEWIMRINDYFFNQLLASLSEANPYQKLIDQVIKQMKEQEKSIIKSKSLNIATDA
jgi:hypothetical protein